MLGHSIGLWFKRVGSKLIECLHRNNTSSSAPKHCSVTAIHCIEFSSFEDIVHIGKICPGRSEFGLRMSSYAFNLQLPLPESKTKNSPHFSVLITHRLVMQSALHHSMIVHESSGDDPLPGQKSNASAFLKSTSSSPIKTKGTRP